MNRGFPERLGQHLALEGRFDERADGRSATIVLKNRNPIQISFRIRAALKKRFRGGKASIKNGRAQGGNLKADAFSARLFRRRRRKVRIRSGIEKELENGHLVGAARGQG